MASSSSSSKFDPLPPDKSSEAAARKATDAGEVPEGTLEDQANPFGIDFLTVIQDAERLSKDYQMRTIEKPLNRSYRAWQNQHAADSKYLGTAFRGRSNLFVPKTRSAVRNKLSAAAVALFSTEDVVSVSAMYEDDDKQRATAAVMKADLDYRLNTAKDQKSGLPWFIISMGGCLDAQLTGVTISKQFWEYMEVESGEFEEALLPAEDPETGEPIMEFALDQLTGEPLIDETGNPVMQQAYEVGLVPKMIVTRDRPVIEIHPIENVGVDPAAPWYAPAQLGRWWYMKHPMGLSDAKAMLSAPPRPGQDSIWLDVPDEVLLKGRMEDDRSGSRRLREGGSDRYEAAKGVGDLDIVWLQENFVRVAGIDYHFWSVGRFAYISKVQTTRQAYPELEGERPYVMGIASIDTHRVFPQSPVESWQPLQLELNDIANLRLDTLKRSIAPIAKVKRGSNVDMQAVSRRGQPDAVVMLDDMTDVEFEATPGPTGAAYTETSLTNSSFDELAGLFSTSSVQSSRQLNETVGGMRMMSGSANSISEFDLRVWVETWVENVLRQVCHFLRRNESDEKIMIIAGSKARVWDEFQYLPTLNDFDTLEMTLKVNAGIGAADPMQRIAKLKGAMDMLIPLAGEMKAQGIKPRLDSFIEEIMGAAGFRDGRRFFEFGDAPDQQQDPEMIEVMKKLELEHEKLQVEREKYENALKEVVLELRAEDAMNYRDNQTKLQIANMDTRNELALQAIEVQKDRESREHEDMRTQEQRDHDVQMGRENRVLDVMQSREQRNYDTKTRQDDAVENRRSRVIEKLAANSAGARGGSSGAGQGQSTPLVPQPSPEAGGITQVLATLIESMNKASEQRDARDSAMIAVLTDIHTSMKAPAEIVRDPTTGAPIGVRKGGQFQQIVRGPDNRITGTESLT